MKSLNNDDDWLGFALSPNLNMDIPQESQAQHSNGSIPTAISQSSFHNYGIYYGVEGENNGLYAPLSVMPLKSDGSRCIMEPRAMMTASSSPKLENSFGGATMGTHLYQNNDRKTLSLSLDSMFPYYSGFRGHELLLDETKETHLSDFNLQPVSVADDGMNNWVSRNCQNSNILGQKMISFIGETAAECRSVTSYGDAQSKSLPMSPGSKSSCVTGPQKTSPSGTECIAMESKKREAEWANQNLIVHRKSIDSFGQRTSQYRGVTRHRWTGRYEAHLWDNSCKKEGQRRKGRQVYLGGYDMEVKAARAYDLAALKYWGTSTHINFPVENYQKEIEEMKNMTSQEYVAQLRRKSSGFSRGASIYRGVTRHHQHGRWQARIGRVAGNKDLYLGTFSTQEEAAESYDVAAIKFRGVTAVTNFDISRYDVERIISSDTLLSRDLAKRDKKTGSCDEELNQNEATKNSNRDAILSQATNIVSISTINLAPKEVEDSAKMGINLLNASSSVTSPSFSRQDTSDKTNFPLALAVAPLNSWLPTGQLRPAVPQMQVFAGWTDA